MITHIRRMLSVVATARPWLAITFRMCDYWLVGTGGELFSPIVSHLPIDRINAKNLIISKLKLARWDRGYHSLLNGKITPWWTVIQLERTLDLIAVIGVLYICLNRGHRDKSYKWTTMIIIVMAMVALSWWELNWARFNKWKFAKTRKIRQIFDING